MTHPSKEIHERLKMVLAKEPKTLQRLAKEIGITEVTLRKFLKGKLLGLLPIGKIEGYILRKENRLTE